MSFINKCSTIIRRSDKEIFKFYIDNIIKIDHYDKDNNLISSDTFDKLNGMDFTNCSFCLNNNDIYGIYKNDSLKMIHIPRGSSIISKKDILTYDSKKFDIIFPYINVINNSIHILYYVYNNNSTNTCALFHHYYNNGVWIENKIDFINHIVLDNFTVLWIQNSPIVFYFNLVNGCEEVFFSRFNSSTLSWSNPCQITNSNKNKLYLSVLKDSMNFYHLTFCECIDNGYAVKYMNGYLNENKLDIGISIYVSGPSTCIYPSLVKQKSTIYLMWVNYNKLYTSISNDLGKTWSEHEIDETSIDEDFCRARFLSNYSGDLSYNLTSIFTVNDDITIIGF